MFFLKIFGMQTALSLAALRLITKLDPQHGLRADGEAAGLLAVCGCIGACCIECGHGQEHMAEWAAYLVLAVYLTVCVVTDRQTCKTYDFLQWPASVAGALLCLTRPLPVGAGVGLVLFALLQYFLFGRMYGQGDVMAFQICSLYLIGEGGGFRLLLLHMALAFAMLGAVQLFRHNIDRRGNLKVPVPFLPYIACSLIWFL